MAERNRTAIPSFKSIQLFKEEILGIGAYGKVCRATCDNLFCAAKIIHETLFDPTANQQVPRKRQHRLPIKRFEQECQFLNTIKHPNIIQYLGMYTDPDTGLPVLLMELMDESLTHFLEAATQQIPYHIQVNICHDIVMALIFLHANGIVHRDLSGNNVLLISNVRAKVTDFGMAKLSEINPQASRLTFTMCPGTLAYMPPEAIQDQPVYSEKIDCFSFGVIVVQILTHQFPNPGSRMQRVEVDHPAILKGELMVRVPEVDRRVNHINQIDPNHPLQPIFLECLKDRDDDRPSAEQLCERVAALKDQSMYTESAKAVESREIDYQEQLRLLSNQHEREVQELLSAKEEVTAAKEHEIQDLIRSHDEVIQERDRKIQQLEEQLHEVQDSIRSRDEVIHERDRKIQQLEEQLHEVQDSIQTRDQVIQKKDKEIQQLREELHHMNQAELTVTKTLETSMVLSRIHKKSIDNQQDSSSPSDIKLEWRMGKSAPKSMYKWSNAAVGEDEVYFNIGREKIVYSCNLNNEIWSRLPDCPNTVSSFAAIDNQLTAIGGSYGLRHSNKVYSLKQHAQHLQWIEEFPPMPTKRCLTTSICAQKSLIVAGGYSGRSDLTCVEVFNIKTRQWSTAADMPGGMSHASGVICGDNLYVGGGSSKSVYFCSLRDLLQSCQPVSATAVKQGSSITSCVWNKLTNLPENIAFGSTLVSVSGRMLAIGGKSGVYSGSPSKYVYVYKTATNSWEVISQMSVARRDCFAVYLPTKNNILVVGGVTDDSRSTDMVEFADLL